MRCDLLVDVAVEGCWRLLKCVQNGLIGLGDPLIVCGWVVLEVLVWNG